MIVQYRTHKFLVRRNLALLPSTWVVECNCGWLSRGKQDQSTAYWAGVRHVEDVRTFVFHGYTA